MMLRWHAGAVEDARQARRWLREHAPPSMGPSFEAELRATLNRIQLKPTTHARIEHGCRRVLLRDFPYKVIYFIHEDYIEIVAISHTRRDQEYWITRVLEQP